MKTIKPLNHPWAPLALAAALLLTAPAQGADTIAPAATTPAPEPAMAAPTAAPMTAPAAPVKIIPSQLQQAFAAAMREIQAAQGNQTGLPQTLELFPFHYSPATAQQLFKIFGNDQPLTVAQTPGPKGGVDYLATLQPLDFVDTTGMHVEWTAMSLKVGADKARRNVSFSGSWPAIGIGMKEFQLWYRDISFDGKQNSQDGKLWFGNSDGRFGSVSMDITVPPTPAAAPPGVPEAPQLGGATTAGPGPIGPQAPAVANAAPQHVVVTLDNVRYQSSIVRRGKAAEVSVASSIKAITVGQEHVDHINVAVRLLNLDVATLQGLSTEMSKFNSRADQDSRTPEQRLAALLAMFKTYGKSALLHGATLAIDDISASYRGNTAALKGQLGFSKLAEGDFASPFALLKKLVARFDVRVPVLMIDDVMAAAQRGGKGGAAAAPPGMGDTVIKSALAQGWVRIDNGEVRSTIEIKNAKLFVNGKELPLPGMGASSTPRAKAPAPAPVTK